MKISMLLFPDITLSITSLIYCVASPVAIAATQKFPFRSLRITGLLSQYTYKFLSEKVAGIVSTRLAQSTFTNRPHSGS